MIKIYLFNWRRFLHYYNRIEEMTDIPKYRMGFYD